MNKILLISFCVLALVALNEAAPHQAHIHHDKDSVEERTIDEEEGNEEHDANNDDMIHEDEEEDKTLSRQKRGLLFKKFVKKIGGFIKKFKSYQ